MSNRATPTWPEGQADNASSGPARGTSGKPATNPQGGASGPGRPPSSGAPGNGQPGAGQPRPAQPGAQPAARPGTPTGAGAGSGQGRPATPSTPGRPAVTQPVNASPNPAPKPAAGLAGAGGAGAAGASPVSPVSPQVRQAETAQPHLTAEQKARAKGDDTVARLQEAGKPTATAPRTRKAQLRLTRLDPWSVMKTALLLSVAFGIVTWVAVFIVWSAIGAAGVFDNLNRTVNEVLGTTSAEPFRIEEYISTGKVMGFTTLLAVADVFIITALATLGSFLYNIAATLLGGLEVTLASED